MPPRQFVGKSHYFHVINRAVRRATIFETTADYRSFLDILEEGLSRQPVGLQAYCLMPNHFHLVVGPVEMRVLSRFMGWSTGTHSKRWHARRGTTGTGPLYQGRFKAFPIQTDAHFLTVCRYVERNPLRANLVASAEEWRWSSLAQRCKKCDDVPLAEWPVLRPPEWLSKVNGQDEITCLNRIRQALRFQRPFGTKDWCDEQA
jgi:putative transposase